MTTAKERIESERLAREAEAIAAYNEFLTAQNAARLATLLDDLLELGLEASIILSTTMRKITVNTDDDIPAFASLLSDYIIKVKSSERNGGFSTTYYFDFDNQSLSWIPTVGI